MSLTSSPEPIAGSVRMHAGENPAASFAGTAADWLRRSVAVMFIATIIITWKLWLSERHYPLAPLFDWLPALPPPLDYILPGILLAALAATAVLRNPRWPIRIVLGAGLLLALFDQNRWQPYVVHFMVILGSLLLLPWERPQTSGWRASGGWTSADLEWGLMPARLLLAFTYLYSGLQKFNYEFVTWIMGWILEPMLGWFGIVSEELSPAVLILSALFAAMIEAAAGLLLFFRRTRRPAAIVLIGMHLFILLALGPLGRDTNHGIWPWNVAMIVALWTLFVHRPGPGYSQAPRFLSREWWRGVLGGAAPSTRHSLTIAGVIIIFGMLPMLAFADLWDSYLSFSFYSGMLPEARITVSILDRWGVPPDVEELMDDQGGFDPTFWAVKEMNAAPYPEPRVILATGRELARRVRHDDIYVQIASKPDPFTGERTVRTFRCPRGGGDVVEEIIE